MQNICYIPIEFIKKKPTPLYYYFKKKIFELTQR
jgi:hypothetical protein